MAGAEKTASQLVKEAQKAERAGDLAGAYILYSQASQKQPSDLSLWAKARSLRPALGSVPAEASVPKAEGVDKGTSRDSLFGTITDQDIAESRKLRPPLELKALPGTKDFDLKGDSKQLFEQVAHSFGLEAIVDPGYQPKTNLRFQLTESAYHDAIRALEAATESFIIPISRTQFLVANDTAQKRTELDRTAAVVIPVPEPVSVQEVQELATAVRGALDVQRLMVDSQRRMMLIRDRISKVEMAQKLVADMMRPKTQVAIEVQLISIDDSSVLSYGLSLPNSFPLVWFGSSRTLSASFPSGFASFLGFGGGKSFLGLGVTNASLFLNASKSNSRTLLEAEIVAGEGQASTLHVGDKYPIVTSGYYGTTTGTGQVYTPPPTFNFEDLGLLLKITPFVHGMDEVTLDVESEFKLLGSQSVDNIPIISNRKFQSKIRIQNGEWAILAGLMTDSDGITISGIAGVSTHSDPAQ